MSPLAGTKGQFLRKTSAAVAALVGGYLLTLTPVSAIAPSMLEQPTDVGADIRRLASTAATLGTSRTAREDQLRPGSLRSDETKRPAPSLTVPTPAEQADLDRRWHLTPAEPARPRVASVPSWLGPSVVRAPDARSSHATDTRRNSHANHPHGTNHPQHAEHGGGHPAASSRPDHDRSGGKHSQRDRGRQHPGRGR